MSASQSVVLHPISVSHAEKMLLWMNDPVVADNLGLQRKPTMESTLEWIEKSTVGVGVIGKSIYHDGRHVGNIVLDQIDERVASARLSVYLGEVNARGLGIGRTAIRLICMEAFQIRHFNRIWLTVHIHNIGALKTYLSVGFRIEGILKENFWYQGKRVDSLILALLARDFEILQKTPKL